SRLVLFDVDWNPSTDLQAMARIHRDGQKRDIKIYRLLVKGGMDEKIWQRQVTKIGLASSVVDGKKTEASFTVAELRDLFRLDLDSLCQTHELLKCSCNGNGQVMAADGVRTEISDSEGTDGEEDYIPPVPRLIKASQVDMVAQEAEVNAVMERRRRKNGQKMQALMEYRHIDTS